MIILLVLTFFNMNSVAISERSAGVRVNPAGLAFSPGYEVAYVNSNNNYSLAFLAGSFGFGTIDGKRFYLAQGLNLSNNLYLGLGYRYDKEGENTLYGGFLYRPLEVLSIGFTFDQVLSQNVLRGGVALKPYKEYLKIFADLERTGTSYSWVLGSSIEPFSGFSLYAIKERNVPVRFGIQLSLGNIVATASGENAIKEKGLILSSNKYSAVFKEPKVVILTLKGKYDEMRDEASIFTTKKGSFFDLVVSLDSLLDARDVKGIFVVLDDPSFSINQVEELNNIFRKFKERGKKVYFYSESYSLGSYLLARSGDKIFLNPSGEIFIPGLGSVSLYFKDFLTRLGIKVEAQRIGEYKSAAEPFIMDSMSKYNREQLLDYLKSIYTYISTVIPEIDSILEISLVNADDALAMKLVDSLIYRSDIEKIIKSEFGKVVRIIKFGRRDNPPVVTKWHKPVYKVAYVVADGSIVTGESGENAIPILGGRNLGSSTIERTFEKLAKDRRVKAVVLRVNSPGGSALASDIMWNAIRKTSQKKPVIVSMGSVAASGGYYISSAGSKVIASKTTLTGSIGVVNLKFVTRALLEKIGVNVESVKIGKHALAYSSYEEMSPEAEEILNKEIRWVYNKFLKRVEEGRGLPADSVDRLGRGRIWSGSDAVKIGLVNENGGILDALRLAKEMSKCRDILVYYQPTWKKSPFSQLPLSNLSRSFWFLKEVILLYEFTNPLIVK
ncbi:MAG: signal peptide peptidase SppA [candidate division WOR-3 bacterium]